MGKCKKTVQFTSPQHLIGQLYRLTPPLAPPGSGSSWKLLASRNQENLWCKHCFTFGHSVKNCNAKAQGLDAKCDTCSGTCAFGSCHTHTNPQCQSPKCPLTRGQRNHRTSQCTSVMSVRNDIRPQKFYKEGSMARKRNRAYGVVELSSVPAAIVAGTSVAQPMAAAPAGSSASFASVVAQSSQPPRQQQQQQQPRQFQLLNRSGTSSSLSSSTSLSPGLPTASTAASSSAAMDVAYNARFTAMESTINTLVTSVNQLMEQLNRVPAAPVTTSAADVSTRDLLNELQSISRSFRSLEGRVIGLEKRVGGGSAGGAGAGGRGKKGKEKGGTRREAAVEMKSPVPLLLPMCSGGQRKR